MRYLGTSLLCFASGVALVASGCSGGDDSSSTDGGSDTVTDTDTNECDPYTGPTSGSCDEMDILGGCIASFDCYSGVIYGSWHIHWADGGDCLEETIIDVSCDYECPGSCASEGFVEFSVGDLDELVAAACEALDAGVGDASF